MNQRVWLFVFLVGLVVGGIAWAALLSRKHPSDYGFLPACPSHTYLGIYCPGCGSTRATHHLLNGRPLESFRCNPLVLPLLPLVLFLLVRFFGEALTKRSWRLPGEVWLGWILLVAFLFLFVVRNISWSIFDVFRPP